MLKPLLDLLQESPLSLWGPFALLLLCGLGLPMPEDIVLIVAGMLACDDGRKWFPVAVLMYVAVLLGDLIIFSLGRRFGTRLLAWEKTHHLFPPRKQAKVKRLFNHFGPFVVLIARFLPGLRAPIFSTAGAMGLGYFRFTLFDGVAALASVPIFVWFGHWLWAKFDDDIPRLSAAIAHTGWYGLLAAAVLSVCALTLWRMRQRAQKGTVLPS